MKIICFSIFILLIINNLEAQLATNVTFTDNVIKVNNQPIFPIGWYNVNIEQLEYIKNDGINIVLPIWKFLIDGNGTKQSVNYCAKTYYDSLNEYFNKVNVLNRSISDPRKKIRVIIQIPNRTKDDSAINVNSYIDTIIVDRFINDPALLGWYMADEPEENYDSITLIYYETMETLHNRYLNIQGKDPYHKIFVCFGNGYKFRTWVSTSPPFYDVLMHDHYCLYDTDPAPSSKLVEFDEYLKSLYNCFKEDGKNGSTGSTMLVAQGYSGYSGLRNPTPAEIKYEAISSLFYAQDEGFTYPNTKNAGGIFFWRYGIAEETLKTDVSNFIKFLTGNSLDIVLSGERLNSLVTVNRSEIQTFVRSYSDTLYIFAINRSNLSGISAHFNLSLVNYTTFVELTVPMGTYITKSLYPISQGKFRLIDSFRKREAKIYKIVSDQFH